jgi:DNA-binding NtrC family response regulator
MEPLSLVIYHTDPRTAHSLEVGLSQHFGRVTLVNHYEEIRSVIARHRADILVLDLEVTRMDEVERLHQEFPSVSIVATHRLADEDLWTAAMNQGAADVCEPSHEQIVRSVMRGREHHAAAA